MWSHLDLFGKFSHFKVIFMFEIKSFRMRSGILLKAKDFTMQILQWVQIIHVKFAVEYHKFACFESDCTKCKDFMTSLYLYYTLILVYTVLYLYYTDIILYTVYLYYTDNFSLAD